MGRLVHVCCWRNGQYLLRSTARAWNRGLVRILHTQWWQWAFWHSVSFQCRILMTRHHSSAVTTLIGSWLSELSLIWIGFTLPSRPNDWQIMSSRCRRIMVWLVKLNNIITRGHNKKKTSTWVGLSTFLIQKKRWSYGELSGIKRSRKKNTETFLTPSYYNLFHPIKKPFRGTCS